MTIELEAKRRTTINALKAAENLRNIIESSEEHLGDNPEYKRVVDIRSEFIVKLILLYYPYTIEDNLIKIKIDGFTYAIPQNILHDMVPEDVYNTLVESKYVNPEDDGISSAEQPTIDLVVDANNIARHMSTEEYAFLGLTSGCGTTHTALMYASILSDIDKTAYVELNESLDICALGKETSDKGKISFEEKPNLDAYYGYDYRDFIKSFRDLYSYVVIDFGYLEDEEPDEDYIRSQNRFLVSSSAKWSIARLLEFEESLSFNNSSCTYLFPMANEENIKALQDVIKERRLLTIPYCTDPLTVPESISKILMPKSTNLSNKTAIKPENKHINHPISASVYNIIRSKLFLKK